MATIPFLLWLALAPSNAIRPQPDPRTPHRIEKTENRMAPATVQVIQTMVNNAQASPEHGQRAILYDVAGASNQKEHDRICGGVLLMAIAISKDGAELPLTGLFLRPDDRRLPLVFVGELPAKLAAQIRLDGMLGSHLWAGLYYAPFAKVLKGAVEADFTAGRSGFVVTNEIPLTPQMMLYSDAHLSETPSAAALQAMIAREYPGFVVDRDALKTMEQAH